MKVLLLDIETKPNLAYVWRMWKEIITPEMMVDGVSMISYAAQFYGEDIVYKMHNDESYLTTIWTMLDNADVVVHFNGKKFDIPHLNREFVTAGMDPPSPYKQIDLLEVVKRQFRFPSNKLEYVVKALGIGEKMENEGFKLWLKCMQGDKKAWAKMREYNIHDAELLSKLYDKLQPWIPSHPNRGLFVEGAEAPVCASCGNQKLIKKGFAYTAVSKFQRYKCTTCGASTRGRANLADRENLTVTIRG